MNKHLLRPFLFLLVLILFSSSSYSFLIQGSNPNNLYFVNSSSLDMELSLEVRNSPLFLKKAQLITQNGTIFEKYFDINLVPGEKNILTIDITDFKNNNSFYSRLFFEEDNGVVLNLSIVTLDGEEYVDDDLPKLVTIILFNPILSLEEDTFLYYQNDNEFPSLSIINKENISNSFGKSLTSYEISDSSGNILQSNTQVTKEKNTYFILDLIQSIDLNFIENYDSGLYNFTIQMKNVADSEFIENFQIIVEDETLQLQLLTSEDDSSLKYFYSDNKDLYGNTIYVGEREFEFKIRTNKQATCYFNVESIGPEYTNDGRLYSEGQSLLMIQSNNSFSHTLNIDPFLENSTSRYFWVGCKDQSGIEMKSLQTFVSPLLSQSQNLQFKFHDEDLDLTLIYPDLDLITNTDFTTRLVTSTPAVCSLLFTNGYMDLVSTSLEYKDHIGDLILGNGNHVLNYSCIDLLNREVSFQKDLEVDDTLGVNINVDDTYYSNKASFSLSFSTSAITESCRYSKEPKDTASYPSSILIGSNTNIFNVSLSLVPNENDFYITCKSGLYSTQKITILYDQSGPKISNLTFSSNGFKSSTYVSKDDDVELDFSITSTIPIKEYEIEFISNDVNLSKKKTISGGDSTGIFEESIDLNQKLGDFSSLKITPINILDTRGNTVNLNLLFDITPPEVSLLKSGSSWIITCIDIETKCSKVLYGFSNSLLSCNPNYVYKTEDLIDDTGYTTICSRGINSIGLLSDVLTKATGNIVNDDSSEGDNGGNGGGISISGGGNNQNDDDTNPNFNQSIEINPEEPEEEIREPTEPGQPIEPYVPEEEDSSSILILSALAIVLLAVGGSGYYAYKKGYLNTQLQKLGIKLPNQESSGTKTQGSYYSPMAKGVKSPPTLTSSSTDKKSKYDEHLSKLNSFLDETLDKKKGVFDSFKTSQKGRVGTYDDTLARKKEGVPKKDSEFGDFYTASSSDKTGTSTTSEDEAEKFEEYYKNKKNTSPSTSNKTSKKQ